MAYLSENYLIERFQESLHSLRNNDSTGIHCRNKAEVIAIADELRKQPNLLALAKLSIAGEINIDGAISIAEVLKTNKSITNLLFLSIIRDELFIAIVVEGLSDYKNTTLTTLSIGYNAIGYTSIVAMGHMLKTNMSLTELIIEACSVNSDGAIVIGDSLKQNTTLQILNLYYNEIGDHGTVAVADGVKDNDSSSLNLLNLSCAGIGVIGACSIALMLTTNKSLIELDISENDMIGTEGLIIILEALQQNKSLSRLNLSGFSFGDYGSRNIAAFLTETFSLKELHIDGCTIGDNGAISLSNVLKINKSLEYLSISCNPFSCSVITNFFAPLLEINTKLKYLCLGAHIELMDEDVAGVLLKTLEDYNDTAVVALYEIFMSLTNMVGRLAHISEENRSGIRIAPKKLERKLHNIFNDLQFMWIK